MRADEFVTKYVNYMSGRLKITHTSTNTQNDLKENRVEDMNGHEPTDGHTYYAKNLYMLWKDILCQLEKKNMDSNVYAWIVRI